MRVAGTLPGALETHSRWWPLVGSSLLGCRQWNSGRDPCCLKKYWGIKDPGELGPAGTLSPRQAGVTLNGVVGTNHPVLPLVGDLGAGTHKGFLVGKVG